MNTRGFIAYAMVFIAISVFAPRLARAEQAATIYKVDGTVKVRRDGKEKEVKGKFPLAWGDKVVVVSGSARMAFTGCKPMTITASLDITKANEPKNCGGAAGKVKHSNKKNKDLKNSGGGGLIRTGGGSDMMSALAIPRVAILSVNGSAAAARPVFRWEVTAMTEAGAAAVVPETSSLRIMDESTGLELWSTTTILTIAAYPENIEPLTRGATYTLEVTATFNGRKTDPAIASFRVLTEAEISEISAVAAAIKTEYAGEEDILLRHMLLALYYKQNEMYTEALAELQDLITLDPCDIDSYYELADIHDITGNNDARDAIIDRAITMESKLNLADMPGVDEVSGVEQ